MAMNRKTYSFKKTGTLGIVNQSYGEFVVPGGVRWLEVEAIKYPGKPASLARGSLQSIGENGLIIGSGLNDQGQIGDGTAVAKSPPVILTSANRIWKQLATAITGTSTGSRYAIDQGGRLFSWGNNGGGQLSVGDTTVRSSPTSVYQTREYSRLFSGYYGAFGLQKNGDLVYFGSNTDGMSGSGSGSSFNFPVEVASVANGKFIDVKCGYVSGLSASAIGLTDQARIYCWGNNSSGQLGDGTTTIRSSPVLVLGSQRYKQIAASKSSISGLNDGPSFFGLSTLGQLYAWGKNNKGTLGDGTTTTRTSPTAIGVRVYKEIYTSTFSASVYAIDLENNLYVWGENANGELGLGDTTDRSTPTILPGGRRWAKVFPGLQYCHAVDVDGNLFGWGINTNYCLGDGTTTSRSTPVAISAANGPWQYVHTPENVDELSIYGICNGSVYVRGKNNQGQLGQLTTTDVTTPIKTPYTGKITPEITRKRIPTDFPGTTMRVVIEPGCTRVGQNVIVPDLCDELIIS